MKNVICIEKMSKSYDNSNYIIDDFSFSFERTGFYVLFGESGSGKTTLLNILMGITDFDSGNIYINNEKYKKSLDKKMMDNIISYNTQENYFIDYLTIYENISLVSNNIEQINKYLKMLNLFNNISQFPYELSGGEKQRLALLIAILKDKKIIILDEPTSALDSENKEEIFNYLKKLKNELLIICSSHDSEICDYCDKVIYFDQLSKYETLEKETVLLEIPKSYSVNKLFYFIKKQKIDSKSTFLFGFILILCFLVVMFCYNTENKLISTIEHMYNVNYLTVNCSYKDMEKCQDLFQHKAVDEVAFVYSLNIPLDNSLEEGNGGNIEFELDIITLPFSKNNFPLTSKLKFGNYFSNENEVILGYEKAKEYTEDPSELIGKEITIQTYDGYHKLKVVGIFDKFKEEESHYFLAGDIQLETIDNNYFLNSKFTEKYINDDVLGYNEVNTGKSVFYIYFDNFRELLNIHKENENNSLNNTMTVLNFQSRYNEMISLFNQLQIYLIPLSIIAIIITLIFYFQIIHLFNIHNNHFYSVYDYYGYSFKQIKANILKLNILNIILIFLKSLFIAMFIAIIVNFLNNNLHILKYQIFTFDVISIILVFLGLIIFSMVLSLLQMHKIQYKTWYELLNGSGDLL